MGRDIVVLSNCVGEQVFLFKDKLFKFLGLQSAQLPQTPGPSVDRPQLVQAITDCIVSDQPTWSQAQQIYRALRNNKQGFECYGLDEELLNCLKAAYRQAEYSVAPEVFAEKLSDALSTVAHLSRRVPVNFFNSNFLFHGIQLTGVTQIVEKITDNARILCESENEIMPTCANFSTVRAPPSLDFNVKMVPGANDTFNGLNIVLFPNEKSSIADRFATVGFYIDRTEETAIITTVQGRSPRIGLEQKKIDAALGRSYARLKAELNRDPRTFLLEKSIEYFSRMGLKRALLLKPQFHPMKIGGHAGFIGNYESVVEAAGFTEEMGVYVSRKV